MQPSAVPKESMFWTPHLDPLELLRGHCAIRRRDQLGLGGLFEYDLVAQITGEEFGETNGPTRALYIAASIAALYALFGLFRMEVTTRRAERAAIRIGALRRGDSSGGAPPGLARPWAQAASL